MSQPSGNSASAGLLTMREWFQQELPYGVVDFGPTPSRRSADQSLEYLSAWTDVPDAINTFVKGFDDSIPRLP